MIDYAKIDTTITVGGIAIHQPVTVFTDYIITILCFSFFWTLNRAVNPTKSTENWKRFFLFLSLASLVGGCSHAFFAVHSGFGYDSFWFPMQWLDILGAFAAQRATLHSVLKDAPNKKIWDWFSVVLLVLFSILVPIAHNFLVVVLDSAIALIPVMFIHFRDIKKEKTSEWIAWGIVLLFITAVINGTKISVNEYFTYLDIAHVFIILSLSVMFVGIKRKATFLNKIAIPV